MEPIDRTAQSLAQQAHNTSSLDLNTWVVDYIHSHPQTVVDILTKVVSGLSIAFLSFVLVLLWRHFAVNIWRFLGYLGSFRGLSTLALWAYRRNVINQYGSLVNIYLGKEEQLSLQQVFVPLTLRTTGTGELGENRSTMQILADDKQKRLVLLGAPGSGKSTLFKSLGGRRQS